MTECERFEAGLDGLIAGTVSGKEQEELLAHAAACDDCAAALDLLQELGENEIPEPREFELASMRRSVRRQIERERHAPRPWVKWAGLAMAAALATIVFASGLLVGRGTAARQQTAGPLVSSSAGDPLTRQIKAEAVQNLRLSDVENSPYTYSNVEIADAGNGSLQLSFDVSRHLELTARRNDPLVAEVLAQSLLEPAPVGEKLRTISYAEKVADPKIRAALIRSMRTDASLPVRLKAQERLVQYRGDRIVEQALLDVLEKEESVQMRLMAIDYLTSNRVSPKVLREAIASSRPDGSSALYLRAADYINP